MSFSKLILSLLSLFILQACTLADKTAKNNTADETSNIKSIGQDMIEMGDIVKTIPKTTSAVNGQNETDTLPSSSSPLALEKTQYYQFLAQQRLMESSLPATAKERYKFALTKMKSKNWQAAAELLDEIITQYPELLGAYLNKALSQYYLKQFDLAKMSLKAADKVNAINPYSYNLQGVLAREQGQFSDAETYYQKALSIWPDYPEAHLNIAVLFELYRGQYAEAKTHYQTYLRLKPNDQRTKQWLAGLEIKLASRKGN